MYAFVIGIDRRCGRLGADLERYLRQEHELCDFMVRGMDCNIPLTRPRDLIAQIDCLLEALYAYNAPYLIAITSSVLSVYHPLGPDRRMTIAVTATNASGDILFDCLEYNRGYWVPPGQRAYSKYKPPDTLDFLAGVVHMLINPHFESVA